MIYFLLVLSTILAGCTKHDSTPTVWIYTSIYNHVVREYDRQLKEHFPGVRFKWYQSGSENVAAKVNTELLGGKTQADLIMTSDLFWYEDLKSRKLLLAYDSPMAAKVQTELKDPEHYWATVRVPVMVIAYNTEVYSEAQAPKSFADLTLPQFKDKVAMASPLESGTAFTTVAVLAKRIGWDYFTKLRANGAIAAGGNSAVIARLETKERPVGIVLLENVLALKRQGNQKIAAVYPLEGAVPIPSPLAITATSKNAELTKKIYDYFFTIKGQETLLLGDLHSIFTEVRPPTGAHRLDEILAKSLPWNIELIRQIRTDREIIKQRFAQAMLE